MGDLDEAIGMLSPEDRAAWSKQFGPLPQAPQQQPQAPAPEVRAQPDMPPPPIDAGAQAQNQQDWNRQRSQGVGIPVRPPPQGWERSGGGWEQDTDGKERFYAPPQTPPVQPPAAQLAPAISGLSPQERAMWMQRFGQVPQYSPTLTPAVQNAQQRGQPRELERIDQGNGGGMPQSVPGNPLGEHLDAFTPEDVAASEKGHGEAGHPPRVMLTDAQKKAADDEYVKYHADLHRAVVAKASGDAAKKKAADEALARQHAKMLELQRQHDAELERARTQQRGQPRVLERIDQGNGGGMPQSVPGNPLGAHVQANFAVPEFEGLPTGWSQQGGGTPPPPPPPVVQGAGTRDGLVNALRNPLPQGTTAKPMELPVQEFAGPHDVAPAPVRTTGSGRDANVDLSGMQPDVTIQPPGRGFDSGGGNVDTSGMRPAGQQPQPQGPPVAQRNESREPYTPLQYHPGTRQPVGWMVREANPVSEEDQGRRAEARAGQQGAIESGRMASVGQAESDAKYLARRQQAQEDIDAGNRQRQLDHQKQTQAQVDKLASITKAVQSRSLDDEQMFALPGAAGQFFSAIGQALGAGAAARLGGVNHAAEYVKGRVNEIVQKQKMQADKDKNLIETQGNLVSQMRKQFGDDELGDQAAKIAYLERAKLAADQHAKESSIPGMNANAAALSADLAASGVKEQIAFHQMAHDQVTRKDAMTKPYTTGGAPPSGVEGADANDELVVGLPHAVGAYPGGTRLVFKNRDAAKEARQMLTAYGSITRARNRIAEIVKSHPVMSNIGGTSNAQIDAIVTHVAEQTGHAEGLNRLPLFSADNVKKNLTPSWYNGVIGADALDRIDAYLSNVKDNVEESLNTGVPEEAHRHLSVDQHGQVTPGNHYTGGYVAPRPMPKGFSPVQGTSKGTGLPERSPLNYKPEMRYVTTSTGTGRKKHLTPEPGPVEPEEDGSGDNGGGDE